jgi:endonuclease/exonuclease/phosphatase family metal-dependent hydrolase
MGKVRCLFWNVHNLYPYVPGRHTDSATHWPPTPEAYEAKLAAVADVLRGIPGGVPDLMAFCEVATPKAAGGRDALADLCDELGDQFEHFTGTEGDSRGAACGVVWSADELLEDAGARVLHRVETGYSGPYGRPILESQFVEADSGRVFTLLVNHWTSRRETNSEARRLEAGETLLNLLLQRVSTGQPFCGDPSTLVVVVGDFNDEPFDAALTDLRGLLSPPYAARDRTAVLRRRRMDPAPVLYNAAWRLLGEQQSRCEEIEADWEKPAGTYLLGDTGRGQWRTYDQVLVSAGMLEGPRPVFDDGSLLVHCPRELTTRHGAPASDMMSDHFPVCFALRF